MINNLDRCSRPRVEPLKTQEEVKIPAREIITMYLTTLAILLYQSRCTAFPKAQEHQLKWPKEMSIAINTTTYHRLLV